MRKYPPMTSLYTRMPQVLWGALKKILVRDPCFRGSIIHTNVIFQFQTYASLNENFMDKKNKGKKLFKLFIVQNQRFLSELNLYRNIKIFLFYHLFPWSVILEQSMCCLRVGEKTLMYICVSLFDEGTFRKSTTKNGLRISTALKMNLYNWES